MRALIRLLAIKIAFVRFRLDDVLPAARPWWLRLWLAPLALVPRGERSRGERLRLALEHLGPVFIKFGQLLSTRPDLIPADLVRELAKLQDEVTPFAPAQSRALVEQALGQPVTGLFSEFSEQPLASASIAQVHSACLPDGRQVIVKVLRPGLANVIECDIALLMLLARGLTAISADGRRLRPTEVVQDYRHTILDELNLLREAANCTQLRRNFTGSKLLYVPDIHWDYCRETVLVQERIHGLGVSDIEPMRAQGVNLKRLAERGVEIFFTQVFDHNFFHADMHPGNIFVDASNPAEPSYIAIDTAIMGSLTEQDQYYLARNLVAMFRRDYRQVAQLHVDSGWVPADTRVADFESAIRTVCEPIFEKPLAEISFGQVLIQLFRTARRFNMEVQPQLVLLQKTLLNIEGLGRQLYPQLDLWSTAHPFLEAWLKRRYHPKTLLAEIQRFGPEWLEKLPQMPQKLFDGLTSLESTGQQMRDLSALAQQYRSGLAHARQQQRRRWLAAALALAGLYLGAPGLQQLPAESLALGATALLLWLWP